MGTDRGCFAESSYIVNSLVQNRLLLPSPLSSLQPQPQSSLSLNSPSPPLVRLLARPSMQHSKQEERAGFEPVGRQRRRHELTASNFEFAERFPGYMVSEHPIRTSNKMLPRNIYTNSKFDAVCSGRCRWWPTGSKPAITLCRWGIEEAERQGREGAESVRGGRRLSDCIGKTLSRPKGKS